jgi:hypothetical protein
MSGNAFLFFVACAARGWRAQCTGDILLQEKPRKVLLPQGARGWTVRRGNHEQFLRRQLQPARARHHRRGRIYAASFCK